MNKPFFIVLLGLLWGSQPAFAGVYWLPDYLRDNLDTNNRVDTPIACKSYAPKCIYPKILGGDLQKVDGNYCYMECVCPKRFKFSQEDCSGEYELGELRCNGLAESCNPKPCSEIGAYENIPEGMICDTKTYGGRTCYLCQEDPCWGLIDLYPDSLCRAWGCAQVYSGCPEKCEYCYQDNCRNRTDNSTEAGCAVWWADCPTKCQTGATCEKKDCSDYPLLKAPLNAEYEVCNPGCNQKLRYRIRKCYGGFILSNGNCISTSFCSPGGYSDVNDPDYCREVRYNGKKCYDCCYYTETCENVSPYPGVVLKGRNGCRRNGKTFYSNCGWTKCSLSGTPVSERQVNSFCRSQKYQKYSPYDSNANTRFCVVCL